jgi:hypothetical protein
MIIYDTNIENMTTLSQDISLEAIQNVTSVYNKDKMVINDLLATKTIKNSNTFAVTSDQNAQNKFVVYKNDNALPPYMYYNKDSQFGIFNGTAPSFTVDVDGTIKAKNRDILSELTSLRNDLNNLQNSILPNNYIKKNSYITLSRSYCDNGTCGNRRYLSLNGLPLVDSSAGGGYERLTIIGTQ